MKSNFFRILLLLFVLSLSGAAAARTYLVAVGVADYPGSDMDLTLPANDAASVVEV